MWVDTATPICYHRDETEVISMDEYVMTLRVPAEWKEPIATAASAEFRSISDFLRVAVRDRLVSHDLLDKK